MHHALTLTCQYFVMLILSPAVSVILSVSSVSPYPSLALFFFTYLVSGYSLSDSELEFCNEICHMLFFFL